MKKEDNFVEKKQKKMKKKHVGKVKAKFPINSILKKIDKDNFEKNMWGNTVAKQKPCGEIL
jgi:hypothetical protein